MKVGRRGEGGGRRFGIKLKGVDSLE